MAEAVVPGRSQSEELPRFERRSAVHGGRFMVGYVIVVAMALAGLAALAYMSRGNDSEEAVAVGTIPIQEDGFQRAREIAAEVGRQYRGANGEQIVALTAQPGEVSGLPLQYIALRHGRNQPLTEGDVTVVEPGQTALFNFCGLGGQQNCALPGQPSSERLLLLRREALELSLYTFRLLPEIRTVVSLLPPVPRGEGQPPQTLAIWFERRHLQKQLAEPLTKVLPEPPPYSEGDITPGESETVNTLTETRIFSSSFEQLPTQGVMLNLEPPASQ